MLRLLPAVLFVVFAAPVRAEDPKKEPNKETAFRSLAFDKAVEAAKKENKVVFIDFYATWCGPCKQLDAKTFSDDKVKTFLKGKVVAIKVDVDKEEALSQKYKVNLLPTLMFVDGEGKEVGRVVGFRDAEKFLSEAEKFTAKK